MLNKWEAVVAFSSYTVEVTIKEWSYFSENGTGILDDGTEVSVYMSHDGDGYLALSDDDSLAFKEKMGGYLDYE